MSTPTPVKQRDFVTPLERWSGIAKNIVEIVAIIVAGCWTYKRFIETEAPAQMRNFVTEQDVSWETADDSACYAIVAVTFENISRSEIEIQKAVRQAWLVDVPRAPKPITYINPETLDDAAPIDSTVYTRGPFVQRYPPGAKTTHDLVWKVRLARKAALFRVDLFQDSTSNEPDEWVYVWDEVCADLPLKPTGLTRGAGAVMPVR